MRTVYWHEGSVRAIDQRRLPDSLKWLNLTTEEAIVTAIRDLAIRGAPAIGAAAAFGLALSARNDRCADPAGLLAGCQQAAARIRAARPTAVNLSWALQRVLHAMSQALATEADAPALRAAALAEAERIADEDVRANRRMGALGAALLPDPCTVIHHCNTGSLATVEYGTALGVVRAAHESGKAVHVLVGETRPMLQGARLTTWELGRLGVPHTLIVDGAAGFFLQQGRVDAVLVGADRIAANGDTANKIGTFTLAAAARACDVPFFVVAPTATVDLKAATGQHIPIECRPEEEVTTLANRRVAPIGTSAANPAFDITPQAFVTAIVTEAGILRPPFGPALRDAAGQALGPFADGAALGPANGGEIHP